MHNEERSSEINLFQYSKTISLETPAVRLRFVHKRQVSMQQRKAVAMIYKHEIMESLSKLTVSIQQSSRKEQVYEK